MYLLKYKEVSHKGTLFSLPGFDIFELLLVVFCCNLFNIAAYVCFSVLLLAQNRVTISRLIRKHSSAKQHADIFKVISLINLSDFRRIVLCLKILTCCWITEKNTEQQRNKKPSSTRYAAGAKQHPVLVERGLDFLNMRDFILVFLRQETLEISGSSVISVTLNGGNQSLASSSSRAH